MLPDFLDSCSPGGGSDTVAFAASHGELNKLLAAAARPPTQRVQLRRIAGMARAAIDASTPTFSSPRRPLNLVLMLLQQMQFDQ